jgi:hypothetical protein
MPNNKKPQQDPNKQKKNLIGPSMIGNSKRLTLTYVVFFIWVGLAVFAILNNGDLYGLAVYFASGLPLIIGYLWSETNRPTLKDASEILKNINNDDKNRRRPRFNPFNNIGGRGGYNPDNNINNNSNDVNVNIYHPDEEDEEDENTTIHSTDASVELTVNQSQLLTLMNVGYVDKVNDKYTFDKSLLSQIRSLIDGGEQEPNI